MISVLLLLTVAMVPKKSECQLDALVWSLDTISNAVYVFDTRLDAIDVRVKNQLRRRGLFRDSVDVTGRPDTIYIGKARKARIDLEEQIPSIDGRFQQYEGCSQQRRRLDAGFTIAISNLNTAQDKLYSGVSKWTDKRSGYFFEWTLEDDFYEAKYILSELVFKDLSRLREIQKNCDCFWSGEEIDSVGVVLVKLRGFADRLERAVSSSPKTLGGVATILNEIKYFDYETSFKDVPSTTKWFMTGFDVAVGSAPFEMRFDSACTIRAYP
jgi:hypothetical protein